MGAGGVPAALVIETNKDPLCQQVCTDTHLNAAMPGVRRRGLPHELKAPGIGTKEGRGQAKCWRRRIEQVVARGIEQVQNGELSSAHAPSWDR